MTDTFDSDYSEEEEGKDEEVEYWNTTTSMIFLVDATEPMQQNDRLLSCFKTFHNIVRHKCSINKNDKMGLVVFGTKNTNCQVDNVMELQKFEAVTIDTLKNIEAELEDINKYKDLASNDKYPLYNALSHALKMMRASKTDVETSKTILLCTCQANPNLDNSTECRRIEYLVETFRDLKINLLVAGLADPWNDEAFYKNLQILSGTFAEDNYAQFCLKDLEQAIVNPARSICKLDWKITPNLSVPVAIMNLISTSTCPCKINLHKDDNEVLETRQVYVKVGDENVLEDKPQDPTEIKVVTEEDVIHYQDYGGLPIKFEPSEMKQMKTLCSEASIETLAFKPIACDPLYHARPPYFITCTSDCSRERKILFDSFVTKCGGKKVMPICKVITNTGFFIGMMIPSQDGGFYLYKMPFSDEVRDLDIHLNDLIFNQQKQCPVDKEAVNMFKQLIDLSKVQLEPKTFENPKLQHYLTHIEALALDKDLGSLPLDNTMPPKEMNGQVEILSKNLMSLLDLQNVESRKRAKSEQAAADKKQKLDIPSVKESRKLHLRF